MIIKVDALCECFRTTPWPAMLVIHAGYRARRYYLCPRCGTVREDVARSDGTIAATHFHHLDSENLPATVVQQARQILAQPNYKQLSLFEVRNSGDNVLGRGL